MTAPDRHEAERFLTALDPSADARFTFQTFDDSKERRECRKKTGEQDPFANIRHGTLAQHWKELVKLNAAGAGIFVCVNASDLKGRKKKNVVRIRANYIDLDGAPLDPVHAAKLPPHVITETSPGRFHAYWRVADEPLEEFTPLQKALIGRFNSDPSIQDLPRVLRIPGFVHRKDGATFLSRILQINEIGPYKWEDLRKAFPPPADDKPPRRQQCWHSTDHDDLRGQWCKLNDEAIRRYPDWVPDVFPAAHKVDKGYRVSSHDLGRNLEEDLSFHEGGIKDFGVHDMGDSRGGSRTPIDIVHEYLHTDFSKAVRWLAQKLGHDPNEYLPKPKTNGQGSGDPATDTEIARLAKLTTVHYERERLGAATKMGIRSTTLDKLVINERAKQTYAKSLPEKSKQEQAAKTEAERLLAELNRDNCVVLDGGKTLVLRFEENEHDAGGEHYVYRVPTFLRFQDFRNLYLNRRIRLSDDHVIDVGKFWLTHPERRQYPGLIFKPAGEPTVNGKLNLWGGWAVTPRRGEWGRMREHIYEVLAARDDDLDTYTINWMAFAVQHPGQQAEVAIVFIGDRGTGKSTLGKALCKVFGPQHARHISSPEHLTGRFNAHMRQCCFLFADEAYGPNDKSAEGTLKRLITEPTLAIEPKGRDVMEVPNLLHVMLASNNDWVIPAGAHERRFVVQRVADTHRQDPAWFGPIYEELKSGGYEAMLFDLLERDLGDWHPRQIVRTAALAEQQEQSLSAFDAWWLELLQTGVLGGADPMDPDCVVSNQYEEQEEIGIDGYGGKRTRMVRREGLYDQARRISPKLKGETDAALGHYLTKQGCERTWVHRRRGWKFPPLAVCRQRWLERFPQTVWLDVKTTEWTSEGDD